MRPTAATETDTSLPWHSPQFYRQAHEIGAQRVRFFEYQGRQILGIDFSRAGLEVVRAAAAECLHVVSAQPPHSVLALVETGGVPFNSDSYKVGAELTQMVHPYSLRTAISGVTGFRSFVLQTIANASKRPIKLFKNRDEALAWLINEHEAFGS
jgi:hypothetical protein